MDQIKSLRIIIKPLFLLSIIIVALTSRLSFCQDNLKKDNDTDEVVNIKPRVIHLSDSLLAAEKIFNDTLLSKLKDKSLHVIKRFSASADSISRSVEDSLILARKDSLRLVRSLLHKSIISQVESFSQKLNKIPIHYSEKVKSIKLLTFEDESVAPDTLGRIDEEFRDVLTTAMDDYSDNLNDYVDNAVDSLGNYAQTLLDNQNDENDLRDSLWDNYYTYGLFGKIGYTTDMQYRGYQGAGAQSAFFPGLFYNHPIGLGVFLNVYNIKGTDVPWDEIELGASYTHNFNEKLSMSLSYTHYTFKDTSEISKQGINGIAGVNLSYEFSFLTAGAAFNISFGDQTDYTITVDLSRRIYLAKKNNFQCWLEPDFSGVYGTESLLNNLLVSKINGKSKIVKNTITTYSNNVFSVLSYQLSLPLNIQIGRFIITPEYNYVTPFNQPPLTGSHAFSFFTINVVAKIF
jgi:hypothetical protein